MDLTTARQIVIDSVLHVSTDSYTTNKQDVAIQWAGNQFCRRTHCSRVALDVQLIAATGLVDIAGAVTGGSPPFHPASILGVRLLADATSSPLWDQVKLVDFNSVRSAYQCNPTRTTKPCLLAFEALNKNGLLYPIPDQAYTMRVNFWEPLTVFDAGTVTPDDVTLNIDDRWVFDVLTAAGAWMVRGDQGNPWAAGELVIFEKLIQDVRGETTINAGAWIRRDPDSADPPGGLQPSPIEGNP